MLGVGFMREADVSRDPGPTLPVSGMPFEGRGPRCDSACLAHALAPFRIRDWPLSPQKGLAPYAQAPAAQRHARQEAASAIDKFYPLAKLRRVTGWSCSLHSFRVHVAVTMNSGA
jgi:hypothetical protein